MGAIARVALLPANVKSRHLRRSLWTILIGVLLVLLSSPAIGGPVTYAQAPSIWSTPVPVSDPQTTNWLADIAVDLEGTAHVIWDGGLAPGDKFTRRKKIVTLLMHRQFDGNTWKQPLDVIATLQEAFTLEKMPQPSLTSDRDGNLLLWYAGNLYTVPSNRAGESAANWPEPHAVSHDVVYTGNVVVDDNGVLHLIYDTPTLLENPYGKGINKITHLADIFYRRSLDGGRTWSTPVNLSGTQVGETGAKLNIDSQGILYATWDEGWDRKTDEGRSKQSVVTISGDGGHTWSPKVAFSYPDFGNIQLEVTGDGREKALAIWRTTKRKEIYFSWSTDQGVSWSEPRVVPNLFARPAEDTAFDNYDLEVDSAGTFHLIAVGRRGSNRNLSQLYHLSWDGQSWSEPLLVYGGAGWPESPRLTGSRGNQLHLVWYVRDSLDLNNLSRYQVWYSQAVTGADSKPLPSTPTPSAEPTPTPLPVVNLTPTVPKSAITQEELGAIRGINANALISDDDLPILLAKSLAPIGVIIGGLVLGRRLFRTSRRTQR